MLVHGERVVLSTAIWKINREGKTQERIFVLTDRAVLNMVQTNNLIKTFVRKFVAMDNRYEVRRRMSLSQVWGVTMTRNRNSQAFILHIKNDHDYHYLCQQGKLGLLGLLARQFQAHCHEPLPFYFRKEESIGECCTFKHHLKEKKNVKPTEKPTSLSPYYFMEREFRDLEGICEYSRDEELVGLGQFVRVPPGQMQLGHQYYQLHEEANKSIPVHGMHSSPYLLSPHYSFYSEKRQLIFVPHLRNGCLKQYLRMPLLPQQSVFYVAQLLAILD